MSSKRHMFATAALVVGEGECRRHGTARDVVLTVETAPADFRPSPGVASPFLDGRIRAEGELFEECRPGASLLGKGRQAVLKLKSGPHWSLVHVLILDLLGVSNPSPGQRLYHWTFLVLGKPVDRLGLFGPEEGEELALEDLLTLLGAGPGDVGRDADGRPTRYTSEGGLRREPGE
jgi:hypothetical protein